MKIKDILDRYDIKVEPHLSDYILFIMLMLVGGYMRLKYFFLETVPSNIYVSLLLLLSFLLTLVLQIKRIRKKK
ncbi:hypothetical protein [Wukongibacter sp. M2B1]|uniref:hypothetical protein n=1 Tax=Wukongibacter sp. M2B1 TaxID=3088895 RepID=UPI003D798022